jgi:hypothetical protein
MSGGDTAKIGRHIDEGTWHTLGGKVGPLSIVGSGPIPPSLMRTIPVTLVEKDIHVHVRGKVDIGPGDDEHRGRCRNQNGGGGGGTLIATLTRASPKPLSARPISVRSVTPTNNIVSIFLCIKGPPFTVSRASFLIMSISIANGQINGFLYLIYPAMVAICKSLSFLKEILERFSTIKLNTQ